MNLTLTIASGVFIGLLIFLIFLWLLASIIWLIYGKRYFMPNKENRKNVVYKYCTDSPKKIEFEEQFCI